MMGGVVTTGVCRKNVMYARDNRRVLTCARNKKRESTSCALVSPPSRALTSPYVDIDSPDRLGTRERCV
jgi:hypothetical protein